MAQLYFYYSSMNAGKSTHLLQSSYNYRERGLTTAIYTAQIDDRFAKGKVASRLGIDADAFLFDDSINMLVDIKNKHQAKKIDCVLIDEAQFLSTEQVKQLTDVVDLLHIPVLAYGIRTDFLGETFSGSAALLAWADKLVELKTICHCGRKANFVIRQDEYGVPVKVGQQVEVGGNERYEPLCRAHFKQLVW
ncbi:MULTISPECIES: thymidine kinase [unclassified Colwellia]|uniref:thymidine kinase n=1 Tax=unclassified Colwellia TaxID=196834 RepID=UPI0015F392E0|nr:MULTISPECIES: thymidine kinase [unclassified Colwellia]MBA6232914.1 thymidine kinase [Colwellia sp. MB02u-7]MBA6237048.1 thymidine kinase [Colwellia sp. MB02u-11]MBA6258166.1 thymidine kinase [Colwellia sp. MB3u-28]MBA6259593.1 thymidine kinase [Colwellia sp. MB3u-41]MBA6299473.1 thymidine kinase [Colwellia sp. MB3u-22]